MKNIVVVYFSGSGHTELLAEAVRKGASTVSNVETTLVRIDGSHIVEGRYSWNGELDKLNQADAIVFGTPTYMGSVAAQFKAFADATSGIWFQQGWKDKIAGGFTISGSPSGDKLSTLQYLNTFAAQHGMHWVNTGLLPSAGLNRLGSSIGVMALNENPHGSAPSLHPGDAETAEAYGRRIAETAARN